MVYLYVYPDVSVDVILAFIVANGGGIYSRPDNHQKIQQIRTDLREVLTQILLGVYCQEYTKIYVVHYLATTSWSIYDSDGYVDMHR